MDARLVIAMKSCWRIVLESSGKPGKGDDERTERESCNTWAGPRREGREDLGRGTSGRCGANLAGVAVGLAADSLLGEQRVQREPGILEEGGG